MNHVEQMLRENEQKFKTKLTKLEHEYCQNIQKVANEFISRARQIKQDAEQQMSIMNCATSTTPGKVISNSTINSQSINTSKINTKNAELSNSRLLENSGTTPYHIQKIRSSLQRGKQMYLQTKQEQCDNYQPINTISNINTNNKHGSINNINNINTMNTMNDTDNISVSNMSNHTGNLISLDIDHFPSQANLDLGKGLSLSDFESMTNSRGNSIANSKSNSIVCSDTISVGNQSMRSGFTSLNSSIVSNSIPSKTFDSNNSKNTNNKNKTKS